MRSTQKIFLILISGALTMISIRALPQQYVADYSVAKEEVLRAIPQEYIKKARNSLVVAYEHTSHGTHVSYGMYGLPDYRAGDDVLFGIARRPGPRDKLILKDYAMRKYPPGARDLTKHETAFIETTRNFLDDKKNADFNVVMWAWCDITGMDVSANYIPGMETLISEYGEGGSKIGKGSGKREIPVTFIFVTGHANKRNAGAGLPKDQAQLINDHCNARERFCLDIYSIDSHDMDDNYWADAGYHGNSASYGGNFYEDFQDAHRVGDGYYENREEPGGTVSYGVHTEQHITSNRKAYAMWWILARIAGWDGEY